MRRHAFCSMPNIVSYMGSRHMNAYSCCVMWDAVLVALRVYFVLCYVLCWVLCLFALRV